MNLPAAQSGVQRFTYARPSPAALVAVQSDQRITLKEKPPSPHPTRICVGCISGWTAEQPPNEGRGGVDGPATAACVGATATSRPNRSALRVSRRYIGPVWRPSRYWRAHLRNVPSLGLLIAGFWGPYVPGPPLCGADVHTSHDMACRWELRARDSDADGTHALRGWAVMPSGVVGRVLR